jgi:signal transduction histidine kinase
MHSPNRFATSERALEQERSALKRLVAAVKDLSTARTMVRIAEIVRSAARELNGADGATFVLRDRDQCFYFDEDAIAPLWKGRRFPAGSCISGWAMEHREAVVIEDIYQDPRIPADAYRPTFVKSLVMVPVRCETPVAAIGNYWARQHRATAGEVELIQALADSTSVAMENVEVYASLERRVLERTIELEAVNRDLEAFSCSVSHDLRNPVGQVIGFAEILEGMHADQLGGQGREFLGYILAAAHRMDQLIGDLLRLAQTARGELRKADLDLAALVRDVVAVARRDSPGREIEWIVPEELRAWGDEHLIRVVLENLLSNALKYTSKQPLARIEVGTTNESQRGERTFFVRDNGAGFDPRRAERLFMPFSRLHSEAEFPGTGVGLATCHRIIGRHGGRLYAEGSPGCGASFYFTLPDSPEALPCLQGRPDP